MLEDSRIVPRPDISSTTYRSQTKNAKIIFRTKSEVKTYRRITKQGASFIQGRISDEMKRRELCKSDMVISGVFPFHLRLRFNWLRLT